MVLHFEIYKALCIDFFNNLFGRISFFVILFPAKILSCQFPPTPHFPKARYSQLRRTLLFFSPQVEQKHMTFYRLGLSVVHQSTGVQNHLSSFLGALADQTTFFSSVNCSLSNETNCSANGSRFSNPYCAPNSCLIILLKFKAHD